MARRVFFSFHFDRDIRRVNQVRDRTVDAGIAEAGFFARSAYGEAEKLGDAAIDRLIKPRLAATTVTVILIGQDTANRPWVRREIALSLAQRNGFLGIRIHHLKDLRGNTSVAGPLPSIPEVVFPVYAWDGDLERFSRAVDLADQRARAWREQP